jgi:general secretion pathway protein M
MTAFTKLTPREKILLLGGGVMLLVLGLWFYLWQPIAQERHAQRDRIARYLSVISIARAADDRGTVVARQPVNPTALAPRVTQSAEAAGITLARLDPEGARLRVTVAKAGFTDLTVWIAALEASSGMRALSVEMSRLTEPGQVSLRMTLEDAG